MKEDELKKRITAMVNSGWTFYGEFQTNIAVDNIMEFIRYNTNIIKEQ